MEILFALIIITTVLSIAVPRINDGLGLHLKASSRKLVSSIRFAYHKAATTNKYYRMVFSLGTADQDSYWLEFTDSPFFVRTPKEREEFERKMGYLSEEERAKVMANEARFSRIEEHLTQEVKLPKGIRFKDIYIEHQAGRVDSGNVYLYFFPNGHTERAVINIKDEDDNVYSLDVSPLTGKVATRSEYLDYEEIPE